MVGALQVEPYALPPTSSPPPNVAGWALDPARSAVLVHDPQKYFFRPFPEEMAGQLGDNIARVLAKSRVGGMPVAYSRLHGGMTPQQRGLLVDFWGPGMRAEPGDRDIIEVLAPQPGDVVFTKWRYSAFFGSGLLRWLRSHGRDQLVICGVYGHIGVLATALDAFAHDIQPFLVSDAIGDFSARHHVMAMDYAARRCAVVIGSEAVPS